MKKAIAGLTAIAAAAGISCARDAPVNIQREVPIYSQSEIIGQNEAITVYKETKWDSTRLELAVKGILKNGALDSKTVWRRTEAADSGKCASIELYAAGMTLAPDGITRVIEWEKYFLDESCDGTFEQGPNGYFTLDQQQFRQDSYNSYMQTINSTFNVEQVIADWHRARGF